MQDNHKNNDDTTDGNGRPLWNASVVIATPFKSGFAHEPAITIARPVIVQITIVSINVPVIETRP